MRRRRWWIPLLRAMVPPRSRENTTCPHRTARACQTYSRSSSNAPASLPRCARAVIRKMKREPKTLRSYSHRHEILCGKTPVPPSSTVSLMTLHTAKGLEYDSVFITGLEEGILPHQMSAHEPGGLAEERRLFYVGITRARRRLYLSLAMSRAQFGEVSV